jgi:hypothetical protein
VRTICGGDTIVMFDMLMVHMWSRKDGKEMGISWLMCSDNP